MNNTKWSSSKNTSPHRPSWPFPSWPSTTTINSSSCSTWPSRWLSSATNTKYTLCLATQWQVKESSLLCSFSLNYSDTFWHREQSAINKVKWLWCTLWLVSSWFFLMCFSSDCRPTWWWQKSSSIGSVWLWSSRNFAVEFGWQWFWSTRKEDDCHIVSYLNAYFNFRMTLVKDSLYLSLKDVPQTQRNLRHRIAIKLLSHELRTSIKILHDRRRIQNGQPDLTISSSSQKRSI